MARKKKAEPSKVEPKPIPIEPKLAPAPAQPNLTMMEPMEVYGVRHEVHFRNADKKFVVRLWNATVLEADTRLQLSEQIAAETKLAKIDTIEIRGKTYDVYRCPDGLLGVTVGEVTLCGKNYKHLREGLMDETRPTVPCTVLLYGTTKAGARAIRHASILDLDHKAGTVRVQWSDCRRESLPHYAVTWFARLSDEKLFELEDLLAKQWEIHQRIDEFRKTHGLHVEVELKKLNDANQEK